MNETQGSEEPPPHYTVTTSDRAEVDLENHFLRLIALVGPRYAGEWYAHLRRSVSDLGVFPGPLSHALDQEASALFDVEVRRMLYYGPGRQKARTPYRILFTVLPTRDDGDKTIIRVLRVLHGKQQLVAPDSKQDSNTEDAESREGNDEDP